MPFSIEKLVRRTRSLMFLISLLIFLPGLAGAEIKEQIVAVVNDEVIAYSDLDKILSPIFERYEQSYSGAELFSMLQKARRDVLGRLIEEKLILQEAEKQDIKDLMGEEFQKEVERSIGEIKDKFSSDEEFTKQLKRQGITMDQFRKQQQERTLIRAMVIKEVSSKCAVSPKEVHVYYKKNQDDFMEKEKFHVSQIWIKDDPQEPGEAEAVAKEVLEKLNGGESFEKLAKKYSCGPYAKKGGDWGFISSGHWNSKLEGAAFALETGKHSGIVRTELGYHIVMLQEKKPASLVPLNVVYTDIENRLFQEKAAKKQKEWVKRLKRRAYISVIK